MHKEGGLQGVTPPYCAIGSRGIISIYDLMDVEWTSKVFPYIIVQKERPIDVPYITHTAIQNRPYLDKFEAPEALDRCIRILVSRRIFLAIVQNRLI